MIPQIDLDAQNSQIPLLDIIQKVVNRNDYVLGPDLEEFENRFAGYCGVDHCVGVSSGTDALRLALMACNVGDGDQVITVGNTFVATVSAIMDVGATPVFVDIEPSTHCMDVSKVEDKITDRTRAIIPVHLHGHPANMEKLVELSDQYTRLNIIEDACQAHGAEWSGKKVGSWGDIGCFSFYPGKNIGTLGDAGAITTDREELANLIRMLRNHGQRDVKYNHVIQGLNCCMDNLHAAVLTAKLPLLDEWNEKRRNNAEYYTNNLDDIETPAIKDKATHVFHHYPVQVDNRERVYQRLRSHDIEAGKHYPKPVYTQEGFRLGHSYGDFPVTEQVCGSTITLPCFPELIQSKQDFIIDVLSA